MTDLACVNTIALPQLSDPVFQNNCYFSVNPGSASVGPPTLGVSLDSSLVGYWPMDHGSGLVAFDQSGNMNNGALLNTEWVDGKFGKAIYFNGENSSITCAASSVFNNLHAITLSSWIMPYSSGQNNAGAIIRKMDGSGAYGFNVKVTQTTSDMVGIISQIAYDSKNAYSESTKCIPLNTLHQVILTYDEASDRKIHIYVDGTEVSYVSQIESVGNHKNDSTFPVTIGNSIMDHVSFDGVIDDVYFYNRSLTPTEIASLYIAGPNLYPACFANYFNFLDSETGNRLLINFGSLSTNVADIIINCTNFFGDKELLFKANDTVRLNLWTNLGKPVFTTGTWNNDNYTTTLVLDSPSDGMLNWNTYNISTYTDTHSNVTPANVTVGYGESLSINFNASHGYQFNVMIDGVSQGTISSYEFTDITESHIINVTSAVELTPTSTPEPSPSISPIGSATSAPSSSSITSPSPLVANSGDFPVQLVLIAVVIIAVIGIFLGIVFKKGYISIESVNDEKQ